MGPKRTTLRFESFDDALRYQAAQSSTSRLVFAEQDNRKIGYPELLQLAARMAAGLQSLGIAAGARVALVMTPSAETVAALIALFRLQVTTVPLVYRGRLRPGSQPFVASEQTLRMNRPELLLSPRQELPSYETLIAGLPHVMRTEPIEALAEGRSEEPMQSRRESWLGPALIQMSSGSTAISKAIWLTESNLLSNVAAIHERLDGSASDNVFCWLPLNHDMGLVGGLLTTLYAGASLTLGSPQKFIQDPVSWIAGMSQDRSTTTMGPPSAYALSREKAILSPERLASCDLSNLRVAMVGAEPVSHTFCSAFQETMSQYGLRHNVLQPCYGLAENCVAVTLREPFAAVAVRHFDRTALEQSRLVLAADASPQAVTLVGNGPHCLWFRSPDWRTSRRRLGPECRRRNTHPWIGESGSNCLFGWHAHRAVNRWMDPHRRSGSMGGRRTLHRWENQGDHQARRHYPRSVRHRIHGRGVDRGFGRCRGGGGPSG